MNLPDRKLAGGFTSPSNLAITTLVAFLCVGYVSDWKMLRGRPSKSALAVTPGLPKHATDSLQSRLRYAGSENGGAVLLNVDPRSEYADRRASKHDAKIRSKLD
jgi:hypothetical protein